MTDNDDLRRLARRARELGILLTENKDRRAAQLLAEELDAAAGLRTRRVRI